MTKFPHSHEFKAAKNVGYAVDLNNLVSACGHYEADTPTNGPGTGVWFVEVTVSGVDGKAIQKAVQKDAPDKVYVRTFSNSAWSAWNLVGKVKVQAAAPTAHTVSATLAAADLIAGWVTVNQGAGAGSALTLPTGAVMDTAWLALFPNSAAGDCIDFHIINLSTVDAEDATLTAALSGFTIVGNAVVEGKSAQFANASGHFRLRRAAADTWVAYRIA